MKFHVCCCLYDHYFYVLSTKSFFMIYSDTDRKITVLPLPSVWMVNLLKFVISVFTMHF